MKILTSLVTLLFIVGISAAAEDPIVTFPSAERDNALIQSAFDGDLEQVQILLKKGASLEATDPKKRTAIIWAAANGHTTVVQYLHGSGADINAKDSDSQTALMYAINKSSIQTVEFLLKNGADVHVQSRKRGLTALTMAAAAGDATLVRLLLEHGADKEIAERDGSTALDRARQYEHPDIVEILEGESTPSKSS